MKPCVPDITCCCKPEGTLWRLLVSETLSARDRFLTLVLLRSCSRSVLCRETAARILQPRPAGNRRRGASRSPSEEQRPVGRDGCFQDSRFFSCR